MPDAKKKTKKSIHSSRMLQLHTYVLDYFLTMQIMETQYYEHNQVVSNQTKFVTL